MRKAIGITWVGGIIGALSGIMSGNQLQTMWSIILAIIGTEFITQYKLGKIENMIQQIEKSISELRERIERIEGRLMR